LRTVGGILGIPCAGAERKRRKKQREHAGEKSLFVHGYQKPFSFFFMTL